MTVAELKEKVAAAEQKVEKCKKTIERHEATLDKKAAKLIHMGIVPQCVDGVSRVQANLEGNRETFWAMCEYEQKLDDIKGAKEKLRDAERILANWQEKLDVAINKEKIIQDAVPQVMKDFLEQWKDRVLGWYLIRFDSFVELKNSLRAEVRDVQLVAFWTLPEYERYREIQRELFGGANPDDNRLINLHPWKPMEDFLKERGLDRKSVEAELAEAGDGVIFKMMEFRDKGKREAFLDKFLEEEKKRKLLDLVERISDITGPIVDAQGLHISAGDLNGIVMGEKGAAKVQTIGAGGYNIQCFHYRTLVHEVKGLSTVIESACSKASMNEKGNVVAEKERC